MNLSPTRAARRNQQAANFRAGQAAYNQLLTNLRNIERLKKIEREINNKTEENRAIQRALQYRMITFPPILLQSERNQFQRIQTVQNQRRQNYFNIQRRIREAKRRVLNMISPRFRPQGNPIVPYNDHVVNQWEPTAFIGALKLLPGGKISKAGLNYAARPEGSTSMKLMANSNTNITRLLKRKRSSPRRNAGR